MIKNKKEILLEVKEILDDERFWYEPALVQINAPLALIQTNMYGMLKAFAIVLNTTVKKLKEDYKK